MSGAAWSVRGDVYGGGGNWAVVSLLAWVGRYGLGTPRGVCGSGVVLCAGVPFVAGSGGARARGTHTHTHIQVLAER